MATLLPMALSLLGAPADASPPTRDPSKPKVETGLDRIAAGEAPAIPGRRIGLIAHRASVTADGRHAIEVLRKAGHEVVRIFAPEHGLRGEAAAGEAVAGGRDPVSGLPVVSLYGEKKAPVPGDLDGLDTLVFDLQGAGVRFYTYVSTLILALEAAADAGVPFVVLDRPNPLGGRRVEGPAAAPRDVVPESFVNLAPGPLVHGLTLGEMARVVHRRRGLESALVVVPMSGWTRDMVWRDTGLAWVPPSPNLRSPEAALAYPGVALLEATNLSEGRGTPSPFLRLGAPWLVPGSSSRRAHGFTLEATEFVPRGDAAAPSPKHEGVRCRGYSVTVSGAAAAPYALGLELLVELSRAPEFRWRRDGEALTRLLGTPAPLEALTAGRSVEEILARDRDDHARWLRDRRPDLLY